MDSKKSRLGLFAALFSMFVFAAVACGGDDNGNGDGTTDGGGTTADAGMTDGGGTADGGTTDGGTTDGGVEEDTGNNGGGTMKTGSVGLLQTRTEAAGQETVSYSATASFTEVETSGDGSSSCETTEEGSCSVQVCDKNQDGGTGETMFRSAGEITISGGAQDLTMTKDGDSYSTSGTNEVWNNSHTLTVEAAGDVVPMFSGEISPAANTTLNSPDTPDGATGGAWTVDTTSDITVEWDTTDIDSGQFAAQLSNGNDSQSSVLDCSWDATSGSETIPSSLLGEMITGDGGNYSFGVGAETTVTAEDWDIEIGAIEGIDNGQANFE